MKRTQEQMDSDPYGYEVDGWLAAEGRQMAGRTYEEEQAYFEKLDKEARNKQSFVPYEQSRLSGDAIPSHRSDRQRREDPYGYSQGNPLDAEGREMRGVTYEEERYEESLRRSAASRSGFFYNY